MTLSTRILSFAKRVFLIGLLMLGVSGVPFFAEATVDSVSEVFIPEFRQPSVILLHGIYGSNMHTSNGKQRWVSVLNGHHRDLIVDGNDDLYPKDIITGVDIKGVGISGGYYRPLIEEFDDRGYTNRTFERDPDTGQYSCPDIPSSIGPSLYEYTYDWRQSNVESASQLLDVITCITEQEGRQVTLVGHSMGGLVSLASVFQAEDQFLDDRINSIALVASPFLGAPQALLAVMNGDSMDAFGVNIIGPKNTKKLAASMRSVQELFPHTGYFSYDFRGSWAPIIELVDYDGDGYVGPILNEYKYDDLVDPFFDPSVPTFTAMRTVTSFFPQLFEDDTDIALFIGREEQPETINQVVIDYCSLCDVSQPPLQSWNLPTISARPSNQYFARPVYGYGDDTVPDYFRKFDLDESSDSLYFYEDSHLGILSNDDFYDDLFEFLSDQRSKYVQPSSGNLLFDYSDITADRKQSKFLQSQDVVPAAELQPAEGVAWHIVSVPRIVVTVNGTTYQPLTAEGYQALENIPGVTLQRIGEYGITLYVTDLELDVEVTFPDGNPAHINVDEYGPDAAIQNQIEYPDLMFKNSISIVVDSNEHDVIDTQTGESAPFVLDGFSLPQDNPDTTPPAFIETNQSITNSEQLQCRTSTTVQDESEVSVYVATSTIQGEFDSFIDHDCTESVGFFATDEYGNQNQLVLEPLVGPMDDDDEGQTPDRVDTNPKMVQQTTGSSVGHRVRRHGIIHRDVAHRNVTAESDDSLDKLMQGIALIQKMRSDDTDFQQKAERVQYALWLAEKMQEAPETYNPPVQQLAQESNESVSDIEQDTTVPRQATKEHETKLSGWQGLLALIREVF